MTQIIFIKTAEKQFDSLPKTVKEQINQKLKFVRIEPLRYLERLKGRPFYKIKVGQYRLICDVVHDQIIIYVLRVASREVVYKFLKNLKKNNHF